jgi:teichuronic acid biosynthesis glycosyltransferase TuaG
MSNPLISVIIPTYNSAKYITETIRSIQTQDWPELEILIMDDGSSDQTLTVLQELASEDSRIKVYQQPNGKPAKARNHAVRKAQGNWIAFIDSDDIWLPGKLRLQYEKTIEANVDLSFTDGYICLNNDLSLRTYRFGVTNTCYEGYEGIQAFHAQNRIPTSTVLMKKSVFYEHRFMPEYPLYPMYSEDYFFWVCLLNSGCRFLGIDEPLILYRVHSESTIGEEIRLMDPLLQVLLMLPGERKEPWKRHTEAIFLKYIRILLESKKIAQLTPHVYPICKGLYGPVRSVILRVAWLCAPKVFLSLFWRMRLFK